MRPKLIPTYFSTCSSPLSVRWVRKERARQLMLSAPASIPKFSAPIT